MTTETQWRSRIIGEGEEAPDQLLANPSNWRIHPKDQQDALAEVLDRVGWVQRVIVNRRTGFVVDGHLRVSLAISRGEAAIPVSYVDLDPQEEALILATFDPLAGMGATDREAIASLLEHVDGDGALGALLESMGKYKPTDTGAPGMPTKEAIAKTDDELMGRFSKESEAAQGDYVDVVCPDCGAEFALRASEIGRYSRV